MRTSLVALVVFVLATAAACADNRPRLEFAADPSVKAGLASSNATPGTPVSFGAIMLCVSAPASATIRNVAIHDRQGAVRITAFAVRPNPLPRGHEGLGGLDTGLVAYASGFAPSEPQIVRGACPKDLLAPTNDEALALSELGVEARLDSGPIGGGDSLDVTYTTDGSDRVLTIPFAVWLCASTCPADVGAQLRPSA